MLTCRRRFSYVLAAALSLGTLAVVPGCEWLQGTESGQRSSPFLSNLGIPSSVLCGSDHEFTLSFRFDDPQGDISRGRASFLRDGGTAVIEEILSWPDNLSRSRGTATFSLSLSCDNTAGNYRVTVKVEDDRGHTSNEITGDITLSSAG